ncbi:hypothetical protein Bca101_083329 [Brassica carinata]
MNKYRETEKEQRRSNIDFVSPDLEISLLPSSSQILSLVARTHALHPHQPRIKVRSPIQNYLPFRIPEIRAIGIAVVSIRSFLSPPFKKEENFHIYNS